MESYIGLVVVALAGYWAILRQPTIQELKADIPQKVSEKLDKLWDIAQDSIKNRHYLRAEKALLTILRVDERNATAYNRLGILYAKQQAYQDAIECFEIAQSLEPSASSLHNVGLIYYETEQYDKAALAFEQAIEMEHDVASRHIAYAKVQEKLENTAKMFTALETALELEPSLQSYNILADTYERYDRIEEAAKLRATIQRAVERTNPPKRVRQARKVIM